MDSIFQLESRCSIFKEFLTLIEKVRCNIFQEFLTLKAYKLKTQIVKMNEALIIKHCG